jgi:hypothetical protein
MSESGGKDRFSNLEKLLYQARHEFGRFIAMQCSGGPWGKTMWSGKSGMKVGASIGMTVTWWVVVSIIARASFSPVAESPCSWKSMAKRERGRHSWGRARKSP